ncbi:MAG: hypothetical protein A2998_00750 [Candidatus Staskawiczbacteria bacterium RIFCSPLOWO2_01_FULL_37_25b]|uniref:Pilus assembly protein PilO n=2 Tax=Candidatus Staskawicziibacteriota TaxID=1817916 RepID=A0A1G2HKB4_9BACT|nr:MAG: hypothetical protein A2812_01500 [Candidatus Staskawiczbacteria bacterium RIFCSPHIGHO2_01_FULL_36_16]OGZ71865.1 MAG: hypothetical protein A2998_00750 [Candidatus Staskawiczbacteria bacterium RIFCSPLOWO2_01_FULL_37_25b]
MAIKKKIYIIILVFFLTTVFLILFFIYPALKEIQKSSKELISEKNNSFNMAKELDEVENFKQKYEKYRTDLEKIDNLFVDSKNPVEFIKFLENTASDAGVRLEISSPSFSSDAKFPLMIFRLSSYGDFSKNLSFIKKLEAGPYLAKIQNLDIGRYQDGQSSKDKKQSEKIKSVFSINVFAK